MMVQFFPHTFFVLIGIMMVFLATEGRASTVMLYVAVVVQGVIVAAAHAFTYSLSGLSVFLAYLYYLIPSMLMLNFILYAVFFDDIIGGLKSKLKLLTAASLISYAIITCTVFFERQVNNWIEGAVTFWVFEWTIILLYGLLVILLFLGTLVAHWGMFIYALKTTQGRTKKIWTVVAFLCPILGSVIYLFVQLVQVLLRPKRRWRYSIFL